MATLTFDPPNSFVFRCSFEERNLAKNAGFRWDDERKRWFTQLYIKARDLEAYADDRAKAAFYAASQRVAASRATHTETQIPVPPDCEFLPYQKAGIAYALNRQHCLIADEMGLGKTVQALGLVNASPEIHSALVVCPKSVILNWQREADKWLTRRIGFEVINYDRLKQIAPAEPYDLLVADEAQYLKNPAAKRTKLFFAIPAKRTLFLTGTPILNRPIELFTVLQRLDPLDLGRNRFDFARRYCGARQIRVGRKMVWDLSGSSNLNELQEKMRSKFMVRRLKKDVLKELPRKRRQIIPLDRAGAEKLLQAEQKLARSVGFEEMARKLESGGAVGMTEMSKVRHELGLAKVDAAIDHITDVLENTSKVVVFAHHRDVIEALDKGFPDTHIEVIHGGVGAQERQARVDMFQAEPECRILIGQIQAAGVGITLTAASTVIFVEQDWVPGVMAQAEDRCHRIGQKESVLVQYLVFDESLDATMAQTLIKKSRVADAALDKE